MTAIVYVQLNPKFSKPVVVASAAGGAVAVGTAGGELADDELED